MFIVLVGSSYYPGGADDYVGAYATKAEAEDAVLRHPELNHPESEADWAHILDTGTGQFSEIVVRAFGEWEWLPSREPDPSLIRTFPPDLSKKKD